MKCAKCGQDVDQVPFDRPGLLICEGPSDAALIRTMLHQRGGPNINVRVAADLAINGSGRDCFSKALRAARITTGYADIKRIVLATDCDANRQASFEAARAQVVAAQDLPVPEAPDATAAGNPSVTILMVPTNAAVGSLETLAFETALTVNAANAAEVEQFATRTGVPAWEPQKQAKMKVRSFLACTHRTRPDIALGHLWHQDAGHLVPVTHPAFNELFDRLTALFA